MKKKRLIPLISLVGILLFAGGYFYGDTSDDTALQVALASSESHKLSSETWHKRYELAEQSRKEAWSKYLELESNTTKIFEDYNTRINELENIPTPKPVIIEREVTTIQQLANWTSTEELEAFLLSDNTSEYSELDTKDKVLMLVENAAQAGKVLFPIPLDATEYYKLYHITIPNKGYYVIAGARVDDRIYYINPDNDKTLQSINLNELNFEYEGGFSAGGGGSDEDNSSIYPPSQGTSRPKNSYNAHGDITLLENNNLLIVYGKGDAHGRYQNIYAQVSTDNGTSWEQERKIYTTANFTIIGIGGISVSSNGTIYLTMGLKDTSYNWISNGNGLIVSNDNGVSWSPLIQPINNLALSAGISRVIETENNTLMITFHGDTSNCSYSSIYSMKSFDGGYTWEDMVLVADGDVAGIDFDETGLEYLGEGHILCLIRHNNYKEFIYKSISTDYGKTWSLPSIAFSGASRPTVTKLPDNSLICVYRRYIVNAPPSGAKLCVSVYRMSSDNGTTWGNESILDYDKLLNEYGGAVGCISGNKMYIYIAYFVETSIVEAEVRFTTVERIL